MTNKEIERLHKSMQTAEFREKQLLEAIEKIRRIISGVETIAEIYSEGCEDEWMSVFNSLSVVKTFIGDVIADNEDRKAEEKKEAAR